MSEPTQRAGRKPGADWDGSGHYQPMTRTSISLKPEQYAWLKKQGISRTIRRLIQRAIETESK